MRNKPTGCPFHHEGLNFSVPESEKCLFKSTSYMLLSIIPCDSGYNPCKMKINKKTPLNLEIQWSINYVAMHTVAVLQFFFRAVLSQKQNMLS